MYYLFEHAGTICTRADLIEYLWDNQLYVDDNASVSYTHLMGRYQAVINDIDNDKIEKLVNDDRVDVGVSHLLGMVSYGDFKLTAINEQIQNIAQKKDTLCRRMYN